MNDFILNNLYLTILLPLWIFLIIMVGRFFSVHVNKTVIYILTLFSSGLGLGLCLISLFKLPSNSIIESQFQFIKINDFILSYGLHIDRISLIFGIVLFSISFLVQLYSISYMSEEKKNYRFYALLNLFNFSMIGLFFSPNLFQTYFFWEIAGIVSYLLIGFEYFNPKKSVASRKVMIINRIGDTALLSGILITSYYIYNYAQNYHLTTLSFTDLNIISTLLYAYTSTPLFGVICALFIIGALTKSAQIPFYSWLVDAMEAKLPVSALLHSSTLVASGVFLVLKLMPFFTIEPTILKSFLYLGVLTAIVCSLSACAQNEPKKVLAYSTSANFGLVYAALGLLNIKAAIAYFIAHAFIKSSLFLALPKEQEKWNYIKLVVFLIGAFSLSGLMLSGLIAKEMIVTPLGKYGVIIFSVISFLTAFYILRIALVTYEKTGTEKSKLNLFEAVALFGLLFFNIVFYIYLHKTCQYRIAECFYAGMTSAICVYILYLKKAFWKVPVLYSWASNGFYLDKFYTTVCVKLYEKTCKVLDFLDKKIFANYMIIKFLSKTFVNIFAWIENYIMNGYVNLVNNVIKNISIKDFKAQNGNVLMYNAYAFGIITLILICLTVAYTAIINYIGG